MSLNEIAVDLTCEPEEFEPASTSSATEEEDQPLPGQFSFPTTNALPRRFRGQSFSSTTQPRYHVHSGMLRMARAMGDVGKPVQLAVHEALHRNPDYGELTDQNFHEVPFSQSCMACFSSTFESNYYLAWP